MNDVSGGMPPRPFDLEAMKALQGQTLSMETDPAIERLAVLLVVYSFRNTVLENYHSEWPEFTDERMKVLMKESVDKLNTALHAVLTGDEATREAALEVLTWQWPTRWDSPEIDQSMLRAIELTKQARKDTPSEH
jgi:hypothetical protein